MHKQISARYTLFTLYMIDKIIFCNNNKDMRDILVNSLQQTDSSNSASMCHAYKKYRLDVFTPWQVYLNLTSPLAYRVARCSNLLMHTQPIQPSKATASATINASYIHSGLCYFFACLELWYVTLNELQASGPVRT